MRAALNLAPAVGALASATLIVGGGAAHATAESDDRPSVVVTTNILGDVVRNVLGDEVDVEVIMSIGSDPHEFAASTRQAEAMEQADLLVINGAGFEEGLLDLIDGAIAADTAVFAFADHVELLTTDETGSADPHLWTDPRRMVGAVDALADRAAELDGVDTGVIGEQATAYVDELESLDGEIEERLAEIPTDRRVLVTNHEVFAYFADRYAFEVVGAVIPSTTTSAAVSAADLDALADLIDELDIPAIFAETTQPTELAMALAEEIGDDVAVVELYTESLGEPGSGAEDYVSMMRLTSERVADALA